MQRGRTAIIAAILFLLTIAVFWPVLGADFVRWDDNVSIFENRNLGPVSPRGRIVEWNWIAGRP